MCSGSCGLCRLRAQAAGTGAERGKFEARTLADPGLPTFVEANAPELAANWRMRYNYPSRPRRWPRRSATRETHRTDHEGSMRWALLLGLVLGVSVPWLRTVFEAQPSEKDQPWKPVERRTNGQGFVKLNHARQVSVGIVSANPQPMQLPAEVEAYGRVLDPTPLATLLLEIESAEAALDASAKEYERARLVRG